ncbi:MazG nucleotide pyrophosphohydrolase domain-containing protein [Aquihabitans daechungensis]|uniref:MazG nucleotide pyrophosphohydrolase domain-containing protein n=1 Tax=Aquihabitans daechungensis TaxID=1052257 RepID=UPI003BA13DA8
MGRIVVVGLGPGDPSLVTAGTLDAIARVPADARFLRTEVHPSAHLVTGAATFDHHYESADTFDQVYRRIVDDLIASAAEHGEVLYAVPGSPRVLERTVDLLDAAAADGTVELEVLAGMSFVDLAWVRLGIDPYEQGVRLIDGHRFEDAAAGERGPLLVAHCHNQRVLSDIKLAVDPFPTTPVVVLQRLGLPDESVSSVDWADLDRSFEADHLTSIFIPELAQPVAGEVAAFVDLVATLRAECPWDAEQTHRTLTRHLLEETYEVLEALEGVGDGGPDADPAAYAHLEEELGDLLFQIVFHTTLATEAGFFGLGDVARGVHEKLVHRHPHVFGAVEVDGADDVIANWEQIKKAEKGRESVFDGMPADLPALLYALKVTKKAATFGAVPDPADASVGGRLLALVAAARAADGDVDPETELRAAAARLRDRAKAIEAERAD